MISTSRRRLLPARATYDSSRLAVTDSNPVTDKLHLHGCQHWLRRVPPQRHRGRPRLDADVSPQRLQCHDSVVTASTTRLPQRRLRLPHHLRLHRLRRGRHCPRLGFRITDKYDRHRPAVDDLFLDIAASTTRCSGLIAMLRPTRAQQLSCSYI